MVLAALIIGYSKTSLGGLAVISVAIFATVLPTKQSTAAILVLLIVGDVVALSMYRRDAEWSLIKRLLPAVIPGLILGTIFLNVVDNTTLKRSIGIILLALLILQLWLQLRARSAPHARSHDHPIAAIGAGTAAGFATMTANAAGAVTTLYLSAAGVDKRRFLGTQAWFFFVVNLSKVPFSIGLGLLHRSDVTRALWLTPAIIAGGLLGRWSARRMSQRQFDVFVLLASAVSAVALLL